MDSYTYRQYLLDNAETLMINARDQSYRLARCGPCVEPVQDATMLKHSQMDYCNDRTCVRKNVDPKNGIGLGRFYADYMASDKEFLANKAVEQKQLQKTANCCGARQDYENYYPPDNMVAKDSINRHVSLGGGDALSGGDAVHIPINYH